MNDPHLSGAARPIAPPSPQPRPLGTSTGTLQPRPVVPAVHRPASVPMDDSAPLSIVEDLSDASEAIAQFRTTIKQQSTEREFKRVPNHSGTGACRVRSFHGRLSDDGMQRFDDRVNDWLDAHPNIEVKNVTTTIGTWDGKTKEQAIVVNIWY
jgi:hypothetical protein